jgi:hypothetical protein
MQVLKEWCAKSTNVLEKISLLTLDKRSTNAYAKVAEEFFEFKKTDAEPFTQNVPSLSTFVPTSPTQDPSMNERLVPRPLVNYGYSCYMNAFVQGLCSTAVGIHFRSAQTRTEGTLSTTFAEFVKELYSTINRSSFKPNALRVILLN